MMRPPLFLDATICVYRGGRFGPTFIDQKEIILKWNPNKRHYYMLGSATFENLPNMVVWNIGDIVGTLMSSSVLSKTYKGSIRFDGDNIQVGEVVALKIMKSNKEEENAPI